MVLRVPAIAGLGLSALIFGGTLVGCAHDGGGVASASSRAVTRGEERAAANAAKAREALEKGRAADAVSLAEAAVAMQPHDASYRALLGQSYLKAGRFSSAEAAYGDTLKLAPGNARAALNLALAQIAGGHFDAAQQTLEANHALIDPTDRGLALALAGDPETGVQVLLAATRSPDATAKTRQNLGLAFALAGHWIEARSMAGVDLSPADADQRVMQWATFAKPDHASDQVATLLGVTPVKDPGQPVALALNASVPVAVAKVEPVQVSQPVPATVPAAAPVVAASAPAAAPSPVAPKIIFAPRVEVVQAVPPAIPYKRPVVTARAETVSRHPAPVRVAQKGDWFVQIGAYDTAGVAKDAWSRAQQRYAGFAGKAPTGVTVKAGGREFYRLSVGGFARTDAEATCRAYRAQGGTCFVRAGAGDQTAQWNTGMVQVAAR